MPDLDARMACDILGLSYHELHLLDLRDLKKQYHKLALAGHPDKGGSKVLFQQINEAYHYLHEEIQQKAGDEDDDNGNSTPNYSYGGLLSLLLDGMLKGKKNEYLSNLIQSILVGCEKVTVKMFEHLDKEKTMAVYSFLFRYKFLLHIPDELLDRVRTIILEKHKDVQIYVLNPTLDDVLSNNIYKLEINNVIYFVPLWHSELDFENDIIVKCIPDLPKHVRIDEDNSIHVYLDIPLTVSLISDGEISFSLGNHVFHIPTHHLKLTHSQVYTCHGCGISKILDSDMYNVDCKGDILVHVRFI
jgi:hypothetical protein